MAVIASAFDTEFTPTVGTFLVSVHGGEAILQRKNTSSSQWAEMARIKRAGVDVEQSVAGAVWRFLRVDPTITVTVEAAQ